MELLARSIRPLAGSGGFGCILSAEAGAFFDSKMIKRNGAMEIRGRESFSPLSARLSLSSARTLSSKATPGRLSSPACFMAGAYGNRTHQEPVSRPLTGFEDRAEHQLLTRSRMRQDTAEHDANR